ncbi:MAG: DUF5667 domain-containing protein [Pseudonocardiales bacterium]
MIPGTLVRRRAERFAAQLDVSADTSGTGDTGGSGGTATLLGVANALRQVPVNGDIDPVFRDRLRGRLLAVAAVSPSTKSTADSPRPAANTRPRRSPRGAGLAGIVLSILATCGVVVASASAVPGSPLYGIKHATESAQLAVAGSDTLRGKLYLGFARTRMAEAKQVRTDQPRLISTLDAMDAATQHGARLLTAAAMADQDRSPLDAIDAFVGRQRAAMTALLPGLSDAASHARAARSLALLDRLQARSGALRASLACPAPQFSAADDLGPVPGACVASGSRPGSGGTAGSGGTTAASPGAGGSLGGSAAPGVPTVPGAAVPPANPLPTDSPASTPVGSAVEGVLGQVLGTLGVSPAPLPVPSLSVP